MNCHISWFHCHCLSDFQVYVVRGNKKCLHHYKLLLYLTCNLTYNKVKWLVTWLHENRLTCDLKQYGLASTLTATIQWSCSNFITFLMHYNNYTLICYSATWNTGPKTKNLEYQGSVSRNSNYSFHSLSISLCCLLNTR